MMGPPSEEEPNLALVVYQLTELKANQGRDRKALEIRLDKLESELRSRLDSLSFTRRDTFDDYKVAQAERDKETREIAVTARTLAMWALGIMIVAVLAAFAGLIRLIAS